MTAYVISICDGHAAFSEHRLAVTIRESSVKVKICCDDSLNDYPFVDPQDD